MGSAEESAGVRKRVKDLIDGFLLMGSEGVLDVANDSYYGGWIDALRWVLDRLLRKEEEE